MGPVQIVRYTEIALKGKNRADFEKQLAQNLRDCVRVHTGDTPEAIRSHGRVLMQCPHVPELRRVFGVTSVSSAYSTQANEQDIRELVSQQFPDLEGRRFRVSVKRLDKRVKLSSMQLERDIGAYVVEHMGGKVDLTRFETEIGIEILDGRAYVFSSRHTGVGGLPVGTQGRAGVQVHDADDQLAALLIMRRGVQVRHTREAPLLDKFAYGYDPSAASQTTAAIYSDRIPPQQRHGEGLELYPLIGCQKEEIEQMRRYYETL